MHAQLQYTTLPQGSISEFVGSRCLGNCRSIYSVRPGPRPVPYRTYSTVPLVPLHLLHAAWLLSRAGPREQRKLSLSHFLLTFGICSGAQPCDHRRWVDWRGRPLAGCCEGLFLAPTLEGGTYVVCWVQMLFLCPTRNQRPSHLGCLNRGRLRLRGTYCTSQWYSTLPQESSTSYRARYVIPRWSRHLARTRNTVSSSSSAALSGTVAAPPCEKRKPSKHLDSAGRHGGGYCTGETSRREQWEWYSTWETRSVIALSVSEPNFCVINQLGGTASRAGGTAPVWRTRRHAPGGPSHHRA